MTLSVIPVSKIFLKIADNPMNPLFDYIQCNACRMSSRKPTVCRPELYVELPNVPNHFFNFSLAFSIIITRNDTIINAPKTVSVAQ